MNARPSSPVLQSAAEFLEIGLMAAASPEFAAAMSQKLAELAAEQDVNDPSHERATPVLRPGVAAI